ncbi:MAG: phosphoribosylamine--glycine ligase, partial [Clostridia bacterium]|nr:phosphoribosylamine--glycine ligase [Clostridia bacterium]
TDSCLADVPVKFSSDAACCVVLASKGYPQHYEKGFPITIPEDRLESVYVAGAALKNGQLVTSGGRVLGAVATAPTLEEAVRKAYQIADSIHFENSYCRRDIGRRALNATK